MRRGNASLLVLGRSENLRGLRWRTKREKKGIFFVFISSFNLKVEEDEHDKEYFFKSNMIKNINNLKNFICNFFWFSHENSFTKYNLPV